MLPGVLRVLILSPWVCGLSPGALVFLPHAKSMHIMLVGDRKLWGVHAAGGPAKVYSCRSPGEQRDHLQQCDKMSRNCVFLSSLCWWFSCSDRWLSVTCSKRTHCCGAADGRAQTSWGDPGSVSVGGQGHLLTGRFFDPPRCRNIRVLGPSSFIMQPM